MKKAVQVILLNKDGLVLAVSRKNNHKDFGLIGGKVEENESLTDAAIRETKEETGLDISHLKLIFAIHKYGFMSYTYLADWEGEINTDENHVVEWKEFEYVIKGSSFGRYNLMVAESLYDMDIKFKLADQSCDLCGGDGIIEKLVDPMDMMEVELDVKACDEPQHLPTDEYLMFLRKEIN